MASETSGVMHGDFPRSLRTLTREKGFALIAVTCFALGLGSLAAGFTLVESTLIRDLPYRAPERLVAIWNRFPDRDQPREPLSEPELLDYRSHEAFESVAGLLSWRFNLTGVREPEQLAGAKVSASFFPLLGVQPAVGRSFAPEEETRGRDRVVLLAHDLWRRRFGADRAIVGKALTLNGEPHLVIGVLPQTFRFAGRTFDLFAPLSIDTRDPMPRDARAVVAIGRLRTGLPLPSAQAAMDGLAKRLERDHPTYYPAGSGWGIRISRLRDDVVGEEARSAFLLVFAAGCIVLVTACGNVLNLLLTRATGRGSELAIRSSLGAGPAALLRPLLVESMVLTLAGAGVGLLLASWGLGALVTAQPAALPRLDEIAVGRAGVVLSLSLALLAGLCFGAAGAAWAHRHGGVRALRSGGRTAGGRLGRRARRALVTAQIALALLVLATTGLLARSFLHARRIDLGFRPDHVLTYQLFLPQAGYDDPARSVGFFSRLLATTSALPGVRAAAAASDLPFGGSALAGQVAAEGAPPGHPGDGGPAAAWRVVTPGYFATLGIPVIAGRPFRTADDVRAPGVVIVDSRLAQRLWPGRNPIGRRLALRDWAQSDWLTLVGVVPPVRHESLTGEPREQLYLPLAQNPYRMMSVAVRTEGDPARIAGAARRAVWQLAPDLPVINLQPLEALVATTTSRLVFNLRLFAVFSGVVAALAAFGLYGLTAYSVAQRRRELAIRMALGAGAADLMRLVLRESALQLLPGVALGLALSLGLGHWLRSQLVEVVPHDPLTLATAAFLMSAVGLLASCRPARRVARIDPSSVLAES